MSRDNAMTYARVRAEARAATLRGMDDETADLLEAMAEQLRRAQQDAESARDLMAEAADANRILRKAAERWRALAPFLSLDTDADPTVTRVVGQVSITVPGYRPCVSAVLDAYAQEGKR